MITWIVPYRDRAHSLRWMTASIAQYWRDFEMLVIEQMDQGQMLRGQLRNIGFLLSKGDVIVFHDVDVLHDKKEDYVGMLTRLGRPYAAFDRTMDVEVDETGQIVRRWPERPRVWGWTGVAVFAREMFERCSGFSNLYIGWGREDNSLQKRAGMVREPWCLLHLKHERGDAAVSQTEKERNKMLLRTEPKRDMRQDGYRQMTWETVGESCYNGDKRVRIVQVRKIGVKADFVYRDLLPEWYPVEGRWP